MEIGRTTIQIVVRAIYIFYTPTATFCLRI